MKLRSKSGLEPLLKKNLSKGQLLGFSIANLIGLTVILSGILFYCDSRHHRTHDDKFFADDYLVISKKVKGVNLDPVTFSEEEIEDLTNQKWVKKLGKFTSADFSVSASVTMGGKGMSSYLFFESVPDDFFDSLPEGWYYNPEKKFVPIVLNKDYLALYNFGFALPQSLPQLSEGMIASIPLKLYISGKNGLADIFDAKVVGFSSRLNTIAVPQNFMDWANERFATGSSDDTSRLILKIDRLAATDSEKYFKEHDYEIAGDKESDSKVSEFMGIVSGVVTATGLIISLLSLFILILSIFLLLQKNRTMLRNILLLGYSPSQVAKYYEGTVIKLNSLITCIAIGSTFLCRLIWNKSLEVLGLGNGNVLFMLGAALIYLIVVSLINITVIRRHINRIWQAD